MLAEANIIAPHYNNYVPLGFLETSSCTWDFDTKTPHVESWISIL
jgi:hypothetical protein